MSMQSFGRFIRSKQQSSGVLGELAQAAARDPRFPPDGTARQLSELLNRNEAPGEFHDALEEAETEWRSLQ